MMLHKTYQAFQLDENLMRTSHEKHYQPELLSPVFYFALLSAKLKQPTVHDLLNLETQYLHHKVSRNLKSVYSGP